MRPSPIRRKIRGKNVIPIVPNCLIVPVLQNNFCVNACVNACVNRTTSTAHMIPFTTTPMLQTLQLSQKPPQIELGTKTSSHDNDHNFYRFIWSLVAFGLLILIFSCCSYHYYTSDHKQFSSYQLESSISSKNVGKIAEYERYSSHSPNEAAGSYVKTEFFHHWNHLDRNLDSEVTLAEAVEGISPEWSHAQNRWNSYSNSNLFTDSTLVSPSNKEICRFPVPDAPNFIDCVVIKAREAILTSKLSFDFVLDFNISFISYFDDASCDDIFPSIEAMTILMKSYYSTWKYDNHMIYSCGDLVKLDRGMSVFNSSEDACEWLVLSGYCRFSCRTCGRETITNTDINTITNSYEEKSHLEADSSSSSSSTTISTSSSITDSYSVNDDDISVPVLNMWSCFLDNGNDGVVVVVPECKLNSQSDPPQTFIDSHFVSYINIVAAATVRTAAAEAEAVAESDPEHYHQERTATATAMDKLRLNRPLHTNNSRGLLFYSGDTQAHEFSGEGGGLGTCPEPVAVGALMRYALDMMAWHWRPEDTFICAGNNDGPHSSIFANGPSDLATAAWVDAMLSAGIVTNALGRTYEFYSNVKINVNVNGVKGKATATNIHFLNQIEFFNRTGYYMKKVDPYNVHGLKEGNLFAIMYNTNLGVTNLMQRHALITDLEYVSSLGGGVYLLGHHPSVTPHLIPEKYQSIVKGQFSGHVHYARDTDAKLFTQ
eukprot:gene9969-20730_t